ncbi:hypothetical protein UY775_14990 [Escherichia coli]|nr:hypothetical protein [Escherichia coli]MDY8698513.1 hypothetical protein [Escherichia coli]MDY8725010.1 hypothetical protein [Escherichia coli]MDY8846036.1 hypothetical protein [Escherichia coli]
MNTLKENVTTRKSEIITTIAHENFEFVIDKLRGMILSEPTGAVFTNGPTALGMSTISTIPQVISENLKKEITSNEG